MSTFRMDGTTSVTESSGTFTFTDAGILPSGHFVGVSHHTYANRTSVPTSNFFKIWDINFTKKYSKENSYLSVHCQMWGHEHYSDVCGIFAHIEGSTDMGGDAGGTAFRGIIYAGANAVNETFQIFMSGKIFENVDAGSHKLTIGWNARHSTTHGDSDVGDSNRPFVIWNLNSSDDARQHQTRSKVTIYEIKK
tara:strand:+ start:3969 stop:4547 length:579 start_codon:yes stop_codon:yes gene_type:complete